MLKTFARHFNETVFRGPDGVDGGGGDTVVDGTDDVGGDIEGDGDGSLEEANEGSEGEVEKPLTLREELKKNIAEANGEKPPQEKKPKKAKAAPAAKEQTSAAKPDAGGEQAITAPEAFAKEAKAAWDQIPPELRGPIKQAIDKREADMQAGVNQLKERYALIDQAIAPHTDALRQMNATPGEAVNRMFLWFKALAGTPVKAFPAIAQSLGMDWSKVVAAVAQDLGQQAPATEGTQQQVPEIPEPVKAYVGQLEQHIRNLNSHIQQIDGRFGNLESSMNAQSEAKTRENLNIWSQGKEYFEDVRADMARLIETGMVPLKQDGSVDLDTAYERAIYYNPEVRAKVLAKQQQADTQVQQQAKQAATTAQRQQVTAARKASVSLPATSGPADKTPASQQRKPGQRTSVRDSLKEAMAQLRDQ